MPATLRHFAINADDVPRAKQFYEDVFGWNFEPWGPPDYYQIKNAGHGLLGALQSRRELKPGVRMAGYEASLAGPRRVTYVLGYADSNTAPRLKWPSPS